MALTLSARFRSEQLEASPSDAEDGLVVHSAASASCMEHQPASETASQPARGVPRIHSSIAVV